MTAPWSPGIHYLFLLFFCRFLVESNWWVGGGRNSEKAARGQGEIIFIDRESETRVSLWINRKRGGGGGKRKELVQSKKNGDTTRTVTRRGHLNSCVCVCFHPKK